MLGNATIAWKSKKQTKVSHSSAEAKHRSMANTTSEILWLRGLLKFLHVTQSSPTRLFCDNQVSLHITTNPVFHEHTKHIEVDCHFVRESIASKDLVTSHVSNKYQLADFFTKSFGVQKFHHLLRKLGICNSHALP